MKIRKGDAAEAVDAAVVPGDGLPVDDPLLLDVDVELRQRVPITAIIDIPYAFARDRGVVMLPHDDGSLTVALREGADPAVLIEVRRHLAQSFDIAFVDQASFERHLQDRYAIDQSAAGLAGEIGTGEELDALASGIPSAEDLLDSADFDRTNPNRMRSLIGAFSAGNPTGFNAADGAGYRLLAREVIDIDKRNPQLAARLLTAMRSWRSLEAGRQELARQALVSIREAGELSPDVGDIVDRMLTN